MNQRNFDAAPMSMLAALGTALLGREIDFFPREMIEGQSILVGTPEVIKRFGEASAGWVFGETDDHNVAAAAEWARQSLDEVKQQTEYQDQKATRLLTVTTFQTAFAGAAFLRFSEAFPLARVAGRADILALVTALAYLSFGLFIVCSTCGALITFHATRTRFKYVPGKLIARAGAKPRSRIFFREITNVTPGAWSEAFVIQCAEGAKHSIRPELAADYLRDLVGEAYLVACKTADKLRLLDPAQRFLAAAMRCLLLWIVTIALLAMLKGVQPGSEREDDREGRGRMAVRAGHQVGPQSPAADDPKTAGGPTSTGVVDGN